MRDQSRYLVVDAGTGIGGAADVLFDWPTRLSGIAGGHSVAANAQRMYSYLESICGDRVQIVLNRFDPRKDEIEEERIYEGAGSRAQVEGAGRLSGVRRSQNLGEPLAGDNRRSLNVIQQMARVACGKTAEANGKRKFSLFR